MEVYTKAPTAYRIENVDVPSSEGFKTEKQIFIELEMENGTIKSVKMSALQLHNLRHNVANLLKQTNRLKTKLQQN
ncbi:Hypothetical protein CINCED_3A005231 [Cinara cedri]|uniref:Uncharacterized protein n=1 Tax=Cinara cedri TaxID=506608 RepID=A0A5E4M9U2_9HEMI|nr:Hypothetical protein CINCED_3A005231 [Cinara cedri]